MSSQINVEQLVAAGLLDENELTQAQTNKINNKLTQDEVDQLISVQQKLGGGKKSATGVAAPF